MNKEELNDINNDEGINHDDYHEYEPSHNTDTYKKWELKELFMKELGDLSKKLKK